MASESKREYDVVPSSGLFEGVCPSPAPHMAGLYFWKLELLAGATSKGVFVNPKVYVHPDVWRQEGVKMKGLHMKMACLASLRKSCLRLYKWTTPSLAILKQLVHNPRRLRVALRDFCSTAEDIDKQLRQSFSLEKSGNEEVKVAEAAASNSAASSTGTVNLVTALRRVL